MNIELAMENMGCPIEPSVENPLYKKFTKAFAYAMEQTKKELNQAVEGMYHNLNTLQSRSGELNCLS